MKISYDPEIDALYIRLLDGKHECRSVRLSEEVALNIGAGEKLVGIEIPAGVSTATHAAVQQAIAESFITSFRVIMLIASVLALCSSLSSLLLIEGKRPQTDKKAS